MQRTGLSEADKARFMIAMNAMSTLYGSQPLDKPRLALFFDALKDLSIDAVEKAVQGIMKSEGRFPVPKTIREYADNLVLRLPAPNREKLNLFNTEPSTAFGKASLQLMRDLFDGRFQCKLDYLVKAISLAEASGEDASELEAEWNKLKFGVCQ